MDAQIFASTNLFFPDKKQLKDFLLDEMKEMLTIIFEEKTNGRN